MLEFLYGPGGGCRTRRSATTTRSTGCAGSTAGSAASASEQPRWNRYFLPGRPLGATPGLVLRALGRRADVAGHPGRRPRLRQRPRLVVLRQAPPRGPFLRLLARGPGPHPPAAAPQGRARRRTPSPAQRAAHCAVRRAGSCAAAPSTRGSFSTASTTRPAATSGAWPGWPVATGPSSSSSPLAGPDRPTCRARRAPALDADTVVAELGPPAAGCWSARTPTAPTSTTGRDSP